MTDSRFAYFSRMFQAVPQLMEVQKHAGGTFVSNRSTTLDAVRKLYPEVPVEKYRSWLGGLGKGHQALAAAKVIVTGAPGYKVLSRFEARTCMVFHGTYMFLNREALRQMRHFDLLCLIGPRMQNTVQRYRDEFQLETKQTGYLPFGSFPEKDAGSVRDTLKLLGLDPDRKTIVYMPWGKPYGSWDVMAERLVREMPPEFNLILRPHPSQGLTARHADRQQFRRITALCRQRPNTLLDINQQPLQRLFSLADLMVTDGTSPAEESLFYGTPQLFILTPHWSLNTVRDYALKEGMHEDDLAHYLALFDCGPCFDSVTGQTLGNSIRDALEHAPAWQDRREQYFEWVFGPRDRLAGPRVHQALLELIAGSR